MDVLAGVAVDRGVTGVAVFAGVAVARGVTGVAVLAGVAVALGVAGVAVRAGVTVDRGVAASTFTTTELAPGTTVARPPPIMLHGVGVFIGVDVGLSLIHI